MQSELNLTELNLTSASWIGQTCALLNIVEQHCSCWSSVSGGKADSGVQDFSVLADVLSYPLTCVTSSGPSMF